MKFTATIQLANLSSRTEEIISILNNMSTSGIKMQMTVLELSPFIDDKSVLSNIQLKTEELKINFSVIAPSGAHISNFASQFNMCSSHYCDIKFMFVQPTSLKITYYPPSFEIATRVEKFFELTSIPNA